MGQLVLLSRGVATVPDDLQGDPTDPSHRRLLYLRGLRAGQAQGYELGFAAGRDFGRPAPLHRRLINDVRNTIRWARDVPKWTLIGALAFNTIAVWLLFCGARVVWAARIG